MFENWFINDSYWFNRPMLERVGHYEVEKDGKLYVLINALGVSEDDIKLDIQPTEYPHKQVIKILGNTHNDVFDKDFSVKASFYVFKPLKKIDYGTENGFLTLEIEFDEPVKSNVKITRK